MKGSKMTELFGINVFNEKAMQKLLPNDIFLSVQSTVKDGAPLSDEAADVFAEALKSWAISNGATHYSHWFQPMTGVTAEKHENFVSLNREGSIFTKFRAKELIKGEPDASSFPSGGIRATFEARGYTAWDPTSYAFIKDKTLCIPTAFCSHSGEILDKKTPLLRSNQALNKEAMRILRLFSTDVTRVKSTVGAEQEYFLIDKKMFLKRKDLLYTGRTLFGARPPKGQEMDDHYFGAIKPRVADFMNEVDEELCKLGIVAKTEHNESAPAQHELAPGYAESNAASDQNQLIMEVLHRVADKRGMSCLLHEKPFDCINGSGKHINWSLLTDTDLNLLEPGATPQDNAQFLLFLAAVIEGVDEYQELLRATVAGAGNDLRLGGNEAPPAIISVFVGSDLYEIINAVISGARASANAKRKLNIGVDSLPLIPTENTDRNRTSPFAFTGNKFEFRMPGSSFSIADPITVLNVIVAESLRRYADILETASDFKAELASLLSASFKKHSRIIFNGNNYSEAWVKEAEKRGLSNLGSAAEALQALTSDKNAALFIKHNIFTEREIFSRQAILLENYCKTIKIETLTAAEMIKKDILPAAVRYEKILAETAAAKKLLDADVGYEVRLLAEISTLKCNCLKQVESLEILLTEEDKCVEKNERANFYRTKIVRALGKSREYADKLEILCPRKLWPFPTYADILYSVY